MSYAQFGQIQASDFNTLVGANPGSTINVLNTTWATGAASAGYGQPAEGNVTTGDVITATKWANLVNKTASAASHQGSSITSVTAPVAGGVITYLSAIPTNLTTIYTNKLNAATQSSTTSNAVVSGATWSSIATFTHTATFANGDAARYFFNSGGQLAITCAHANNTAGINLLLNNLCSNVGTVVMSAPTSGTATVAGTAYNGITRVGGGGNAPTISTVDIMLGQQVMQTFIIKQLQLVLLVICQLTLTSLLRQMVLLVQTVTLATLLQYIRFGMKSRMV